MNVDTNTSYAGLLNDFRLFAEMDMRRLGINKKGSGFHQFIMRAALLAKNRLIRPSDARKVIEDLAPRALSSPDEVEVAVNRAYEADEAPADPRSGALRRCAEDPILLRELAGKRRECGLDWWRERRSGPRSVQGFARRLFRPGEVVGLQGERNGVRRFKAWRHDEEEFPDEWARRWDNVFLCDKPLKPDAASWGKKFVARYDFAVLESDTADADDWCRFLATFEFEMGRKIVAVVLSGARSVHGWWQVGENLPDPSAWKDAVWEEGGRFVKTAVRCGGDRTVLSTSVRVARLPQALRRPTGKIQNLVWLSPSDEA